MQLEPDDAIAHADQFAISAMRLQIGSHCFYTAQHPRLYVIRMERVQQKHARYQIVLERLVQHPLTLQGCKALVDHPLQCGTMQFDDRLDKLKGCGPDFWIAGLIEFASQLLYAFGLGAELSALRWRHRLLNTGRHYSCPAGPDPDAPNMGECRVSITLPSPTYI